MTSTSRSHPKSFSSFLLTSTMLTVALLAFEPVAFGQAGDPGGDTVSKELSLNPVSDKVVQSMFYKAQHQETGNMWDVWLFHHEGTYTFDTKQGIIMEGTLRLPQAKDSARCGVYIECTNDLGAGLLIDSTGVAELGPMNADGTGFTAEKHVDREMTFGSPAAFRLLVRGSLMEFYLDDILIESFALPANATGRIGLINAVDTMGTLKAWN